MIKTHFVDNISNETELIFCTQLNDLKYSNSFHT